VKSFPDNVKEQWLTSPSRQVSFALGYMDATLSTALVCNFYNVKITKVKNGKEAIFYFFVFKTTAFPSGCGNAERPI
jgi:hypothetical protein